MSLIPNLGNLFSFDERDYKDLREKNELNMLHAVHHYAQEYGVHNLTQSLKFLGLDCKAETGAFSAKIVEIDDVLECVENAARNVEGL